MSKKSIEEIEEKIVEKKKKLAEFESKLEDANHEWNKFDRRFSQLSLEIDKIFNKKKSIERKKVNTYQKAQKLVDKSKAHAKKRNELNEKVKEIKEVEIRELAKQVEELKSERRTVISGDVSIRQVLNQIKLAETELAGMEQKLQTGRVAMKYEKKHIDRMRKLKKKIDKLKKDELADTLKKIDKKIEKINNDIEKLWDKRREIIEKANEQQNLFVKASEDAQPLFAETRALAVEERDLHHEWNNKKHDRYQTFDKRKNQAEISDKLLSKKKRLERKIVDSDKDLKAAQMSVGKLDTSEAVDFFQKGGKLILGSGGLRIEEKKKKEKKE